MKKQYSKSRPTCKVTFHLPKEAVTEAQHVEIIGDFNNWSLKEAIPLKAKKNGSFETQLELETGKEYEFRYLIDGERWENDWKADKYVPSPYPGVENSLVSTLDGEAAPAKEVKENGSATPKKKTAKKAEKSSKDKLEKIEGIGPKIAKTLNEQGITTWKKLADTSATKLREILVSASPRYKMYDPTSWPEQARLAAEGKWDELKKLQDELQAGRAK